MTEEIKNDEVAPKAEAPKAEAPKAEAPKAVIAKKPITLEQKFDALCKLQGIAFKEDAGKVIAIR